MKRDGRKPNSVLHIPQFSLYLYAIYELPIYKHDHVILTEGVGRRQE